jgi:putative hydrolase of the HAD superfamily
MAASKSLFDFKASFSSKPPCIIDPSGGPVPEIRALFWDVGGVLLTNAWDHEERNLAFERFHLDKDEFEKRHTESVRSFEEGRISLDEYLQCTVFYEPRDFQPEEFKQFMLSLSKPKSDVLEIARALRGKFLMGTINNESRELNQYRIDTYRLTECFDVFVSSCFVGIRKPDERIYRLALDLAHRAPEECGFIDDRPVNVEAAAKVGLCAILLRSPSQLKSDLRKVGVEI